MPLHIRVQDTKRGNAVSTVLARHPVKVYDQQQDLQAPPSPRDTGLA